MVQSDLYIHGPQAQRDAIVQMVMIVAERIGVDTTDESALNIPSAWSWKYSWATQYT